MLSILRNAVAPARREMLVVRALSTTSPVLLEAAKRGRPKGSLNAPKTGDAASAKATKPKAKKAEKPKKLTKATIPAEDVPPKRPMSAYARFFKEWFEKNGDSLRQQGKLDITQLSRTIGTAWSDLQVSDPAKVERMKAQAKVDQEAFEKAYGDWYFARTPAERTVVEKALGRRLQFPGGRAAFNRDLRDRPGNPGRPSSSFFEYLRSLQPELKNHPDIAGKPGIESHQAIAKIAAERWRTLPEAEKEHWKQVTTERREKFNEWFKTQKESGPQK
ncbi:hypothetical protein CcaverHIS002_0701420 [Cutaneotrichosporon cavernicola]|uniref:HMG box domain-containing protein n=1 Tax=Cutaneotrichosporon cavernicola TaxID=279322 RepID=A0AA48L9Z5_9TREE|nr:uncharacterized protein CcaverHIS019_0701450 [Cutaneotrichosporon cavernicola]BEI86796.1 hypothetical protein CcaverHIS002_0701420 [Cutaneotrichosporon cavernicola]BEI94573.1 hypothetical protein CcaverHIS019_0701450 [Cutaneotrichosporon cavernicola]BEJ02349.1 hypothetical protein CcaverHIS631_0701440 [Cutaneotrichosporon cavernicola]BEJ10107.1 hypothetical protein CcaverHIS641_0701420 [Cutaneotrichosporon cavernicola]